MIFNIARKATFLLISFFIVITSYSLTLGPQSEINDYDNDYRAHLNKQAINLLDSNYAGYKIYEDPCIQHFTQFKSDEYLLTLLNPNHKTIKYLLFSKGSNTFYYIKKFGSHKLSPENIGWQNTICGTSSEALEQWKTRDSKVEKWFIKPKENNFDYFCVIRDTKYFYTCYQYHANKKKFLVISGSYYSMDF
ncbi:MAG TPA: hypothetical protein VHE99_06120 [Gammaproteobacteria bacterium]|nr:hypothetical protein [Gammaproteobacteria bacterium]